ncbi:uncharacterized protein LOC122048179 [Zingiber officinale]|uniref:uncharacterized protein LOC122048179 n=1 Tax=Zingiber officinale TaxID=94328 RepID=UPI001C4C30EA|nr:uncharacterized protein LOC122048179 [Zingiber officinale]
MALKVVYMVFQRLPPISDSNYLLWTNRRSLVKRAFLDFQQLPLSRQQVVFAMDLLGCGLRTLIGDRCLDTRFIAIRTTDKGTRLFMETLGVLFASPHSHQETCRCTKPAELPRVSEQHGRVVDKHGRVEVFSDQHAQGVLLNTGVAEMLKSDAGSRGGHDRAV